METQFLSVTVKLSIMMKMKHEDPTLTVYNGVLWQAKGAARGRGKAGSVNIVE